MRVCRYSAYNTAIKCQYHALKAKCNEDVGRVYATYVQKALRGYMSEDCAVGQSVTLHNVAVVSYIFYAKTQTDGTEAWL